jgi:hypothetical protein
MHYLELLDRLHAALRPRTYLEIGIERGQSLALSRTRTIGVDPFPYLEPECYYGKPSLKLYRESSDEFFRTHTAGTVLEGEPLDLAFVDGLHAFAQVVRDLEYVERWGHAGTVIVVHDVLPQDAWQATRASHEGAWTGDVWRVVPFLEEHRPDLRCWLVGVEETGALVITNLDPGHASLVGLADALDRDYPPDGSDYARLAQRWLAEARPAPPREVLRALHAPPRATTSRMESRAWTERPDGWVPVAGARTGSLRIIPEEEVRGSYRVRLVLAAREIQVLRIQAHYTGPAGPRFRNLYLDVTYPGAIFHGVDAVWLDPEPAGGGLEIEWEARLAAGESLLELTLDPLDFWLRDARLEPEMAIAPRRVEIAQIGWPRSSTRWVAERFPGREPAPKRKDGKRDAVILAWWVPETAEARKTGEYYLGLLRYHHPDSKIFVGINHGSDPAWLDVLHDSGLDVEIAATDPAVQVNSDVGGFLAALGAFARDSEEFDLAWFGHTKGASRTTFEDALYNHYRYQHDRRFWSRRGEIETFFADPRVGYFAHRYGLHDPSPESPWRGFVELDALRRVYRDTYQPLGLWAWETVFVMRAAIVRRFCEAVGWEFFRVNPPDYGADRWFFEAAFTSVASMQGYEPWIELETDTYGFERDDVVLYIDPAQGNRHAMEELQRWRENPLEFQPRAIPRF